MLKSRDSAYHAYQVKFARANDPVKAEENARRIYFPVSQEDSVLYLPDGFAINKDTHFRNQQVLVVIEVPVGKQVRLDNATEHFSWFTVNTRFNHLGGYNIGIDDDNWNNDDLRKDVWYTMTATGLERTDRKSDDEDNTDDWNSEQNKSDKNNDGYRYRKGEKNYKIDSIDIKMKGKDTSINIKLNTLNGNSGPKEGEETSGSGKTPSGKYAKFSSHMISVTDLMRIGG